MNKVILTDSQIFEIEQKSQRSNEVDVMDFKKIMSHIRTLQQHNAQMKEAVETAIIHLQDGDLLIRASQLRNRLRSIQGGPQ